MDPPKRALIISKKDPYRYRYRYKFSRGSRSTLGFYNLPHESTGVQNWGFHFLHPPRALGKVPHKWLLLEVWGPFVKCNIVC